MSKVLVITDTVSGISSELAREHSIRIVPAAIIVFDGTSYPDGVGIGTKEAYQLLEKDPDKFSVLPVSAGYLFDIYREASQETESIVHISFSSALSGAYNTASLAASLLREESLGISIRVIDSKTAAGAEGLLAIAAAKAAAGGMNLEQVADVVGQARQKTGGIMMLDTLRYVYRTGRMPKTVARLVSLLNIKPINRMTDEGRLEMIGRVRKREDGYQKLIESIKREAETDALHFMVSHANAPEMGERIVELLKQHFDCLSLAITEYSPIMGYSVGPGSIFIGFRPGLDLLGE